MDAHAQIPAALGIDGLGDLDARGAFSLAAEAGYRGVAFATNHPELNPAALGPTARRHVRTILAGKHLGLESLRAAAPRGGLTDAATIDRTIDNASKAMTLARELGIATVSLNVGTLTAGGGGGVPEGTVISALRQLAQQADAAGVALTLSADGGTAALGRIIKAVDFDRAKMNLEGGRAIAGGENILVSLESTADMIGQMTASDAIKSGGSVRAVMLGEGQLPLKELMELLREQGFQGPWLVDVRDLGDGRLAAMRAADVLRRVMH